MNNLQKEIYETWELWKDDKDDDFYNTYVYTILEEQEMELREHYLGYWEGLKKHGGELYP